MPVPSTAPVPQPSPPPAPRRGMSRPKQIALAAGAALVLALSAAGVFHLVTTRSAVAENGSLDEDSEAERQSRIQPLVEQGRQKLEAGEPAAALEQFEQALAIAPDDRDVQRLREQAKRQILQLDGGDLEDVADRITEADEALASGDYPTTIRLAEEILAVDPDHPRGNQLLEQARAGERRLAQTRARIQNRPPPSDPSTHEPPPPPAAKEPVAQKPGVLKIEFFSEVSEGKLTIFDGQAKLFQQTFKFVGEKPGFLRRRKKVSGSLSGRLTLPAGTLDLKIYVRPKGAKTDGVELEVILPPGATRVLQVRVTAAGKVSAELE